MGTRCICYREPTSSFWEAKLFYKRDHTAFISPYCLMGSLDCVETGCSEMEHQLRMFPVILSSKMELQSRIRCQWSYAGKLLGSVWFHIQKSHLACLECCVWEREREGRRERKGGMGGGGREALLSFSWRIKNWVIRNILKVKVAQLCLALCNPMNYNSAPGFSVHGILQARILVCHSLLQGIFPTQRWNRGVLHCRPILYHLNHQGSPETY